MHRILIAVVVAALLATPLALLARAMSCESSACIMTCCLPHGSQSHPGMMCRCSNKSGKQLPDFGRIAPIAPTTPEEFASVDAPDGARWSVRSLSPSTVQGFASAPFTPPRA